MNDLSDVQWCLLDLLMRSKQRGIDVVSRAELLASEALPQTVRVQLVWAALTMPGDFIRHVGSDFAITDNGVSIYNLRFGSAARKPQPTPIADVVICLPGPEAYIQ